MRHLAFIDAEEVLDFSNRTPGRDLGLQLAGDAMHVAMRHVRRPDEIVIGELVILAGSVGERSAHRPRKDECDPRGIST